MQFDRDRYVADGACGNGSSSGNFRCQASRDIPACQWTSRRATDGSVRRRVAISRLLLVSSLLALLVMTACAPLTDVRRTALIPTITPPARIGAPLKAAEVRLTGEVGGVNPLEAFVYDYDLYTEVGSPGVYIPRLELGASGYVGVTENIELGVRFQYTNAFWSRPNTVGVLPFPAGENVSLAVGGLGIRANAPFSGPRVGGAVSFIGELNGVLIPQATYVCDYCSDSYYDGDPVYTLYSFNHERFLIPNLAVQGGVFLGDFVFVDGMAGATFSITNVGFDPDLESVDESTLQMFLAAYVGAGIEFRVDQFVAGLHLYAPIHSQDDIYFGPMTSMQVGADF